ncbi:ABC transporter permease [Salsipaludibacter albus]|uniref:ABC transporter permease n=1 Tax=Salsipaludibacter albus TaxID=2849650 RepID=UPI001EE442DE|nr:ABC transporter permease [Salsipaludibacter albus]MBY5161875.1 ABC transporter permease [Salsipaludibacter albus]
MWAMVLKEMRQVRRDRRTLAMMVVLPVLLLVVFGYAARFDVAEIRVVPVGDQVASAAQQLPEPFTVLAATDDDPVDVLRRGDADVAIALEGGTPTAHVDGSELFTAQASQQAFAGIAAAGGPSIDVVVEFNPDLETSAVLVPGLGGLILVFVGSLITSLGVVRERQAGTLEQLAVMPLRASDVFVGKVAPYFVVASVDLVVVLGVGSWLFGVPFNGNPAWLAIGSLLFLFTALGIGVLISTVSDNQGQAIQLALMTVLPQVLLSGLIFPLSSMAAGVRWIGYLLPLTWFNVLARGVMLKDAPLSALALPLGVLALMAVVVSTLAVWRFNTELRPAGPGDTDLDPARRQDVPAEVTS